MKRERSQLWPKIKARCFHCYHLNYFDGSYGDSELAKSRLAGFVERQECQHCGRILGEAPWDLMELIKIILYFESGVWQI